LPRSHTYAYSRAAQALATPYAVPVGTKTSHQKAKRDADKKVICARWDATNAPDQNRADRRAFGRSNIGVLTGPENAFFVVDADTIAGSHAVLFQATAILGGYILGDADFTPDKVKVAMVAASKLNGSFDKDGEQQIDLTIESGLQSDRTCTGNKSPGDNMVRLVVPASDETHDGADENPDGADDDEPPGVSDIEFALADKFIAEHKADHRYFAAAPSEVR